MFGKGRVGVSFCSEVVLRPQADFSISLEKCWLLCAPFHLHFFF